MKFTDIRENEEILKKLERILGTCLNTRDSIEYMLNKYTDMSQTLNESELIEDIGIVSSNLNNILNSADPIFKHYLVVPNSTENENIPYILNTRKNDDLTKYEYSLLEKTKTKKISNEIIFDNNNNLENFGSPYSSSSNHIDGSELNKISYNIDNISILLCEKLREHSKVIEKRHTKKEEPDKNVYYKNVFDTLKEVLNKK